MKIKVKVEITEDDGKEIFKDSCKDTCETFEKMNETVYDMMKALAGDLNEEIEQILYADQHATIGLYGEPIDLLIAKMEGLSEGTEEMTDLEAR